MYYAGPSSSARFLILIVFSHRVPRPSLVHERGVMNYWLKHPSQFLEMSAPACIMTPCPVSDLRSLPFLPSSSGMACLHVVDNLITDCGTVAGIVALLRRT